MVAKSQSKYVTAITFLGVGGNRLVNIMEAPLGILLGCQQTTDWPYFMVRKE